MKNQTVLLFDGDCGICQRFVSVLAGFSPTVVAVPFQAAEFDRGVSSIMEQFELTRSRLERAMYLTDGSRLWRGHQAFNEILNRRGGLYRVGAFVLSLAPISMLEGLVYAFVAANRQKLSSALGLASCSTAKARKPRDG